ncbi:MAG: WYL domain-containing protein [Lachnospiraceae bacterium]|nr:WYL domain-containing protein [Lachnospiraceae bacterium]
MTEQYEERIKRIDELVLKTREGDEGAWKELYAVFWEYEKKAAERMLKEFFYNGDYRAQMLEDLTDASWCGFICAFRNYNPEKGSFFALAQEYIRGEMVKELDFLLNRLGFADKVKYRSSGYREIALDSDEIPEGLDLEIYNTLSERLKDKTTIPEGKDRGDYSTERETLQILEILKLLTDENHSLKMSELEKLLSYYQLIKYDNNTAFKKDAEKKDAEKKNPNIYAVSATFKKRIAEILFELNPEEYAEKNEGKYALKYEGYKTDELQKKVKYQKNSETKIVTDSAPVINGLSYVHIFDNDTLDKLIQMISFTDLFSNEEKCELIGKLQDTASVYYRSPFFSEGRLKFNPGAIHSRRTDKKLTENKRLSENLKILQTAINRLGQVRFKFSGYNALHELEANSYFSYLSPYHLVEYQDNYYCIGLKSDGKQIWHYRVDLMTELEIVKDEEGNIQPMEIVPLRELPILNENWDPEKYMAEHIYMAYDKPRPIRIKVKNNAYNYTALQNWFGSHFRKVSEDGDGYDIVEIVNSSEMIVYWALQYPDVEILDGDIREKIREKIKSLNEKYAS